MGIPNYLHEKYAHKPISIKSQFKCRPANSRQEFAKIFKMSNNFISAFCPRYIFIRAFIDQINTLK